MHTHLFVLRAFLSSFSLSLLYFSHACRIYQSLSHSHTHHINDLAYLPVSPLYPPPLFFFSYGGFALFLPAFLRGLFDYFVRFVYDLGHGFG